MGIIIILSDCLEFGLPYSLSVNKKVWIFEMELEEKFEYYKSNSGVACVIFLNLWQYERY